MNNFQVNNNLVLTSIIKDDPVDLYLWETPCYVINEHLNNIILFYVNSGLPISTLSKLVIREIKNAPFESELD